MLEGQNFEEEKNSDQKFLSSKREAFIKTGQDPLIGTGYASKIYYFNSIVKIFN
jgi:hypothetical protein